MKKSKRKSHTSVKHPVARKVGRVARVAQKVVGKYSATVEVNEKKYSAKGASALAACEAIQVPTQLFKTKLWLHLTFGKKKSSQMLLAIQWRRFMYNSTSRQIIVKRLELRLA